VGDTVIVHFENHLSRPTGIHWHGIELPNEMDGTPFTQNQVQPGGTFLYKFKVNRPGIFWYHPHHHSSTNQVFKGMYGMIVVEDPNDGALRAAGSLPPAVNTRQLVLSDTTVCKAPGSNDTATYDPSLPHVSGGPLPVQQPPTPRQLCEDSPIDEEGAPRGPFAAGDIPNIQQPPGGDPENEGQTVLTNGRNVGSSTMDVKAGDGLRLQIVNAATIRYMRLRLTTSTGVQVPLVRVGGEGGLLDNALVEGGVTPSGFDTQFSVGEIVLPPGSRADIVAAIPPDATGTLTLWTEDYQRTASGYANLPTVPVMHLSVSGQASSTYTIPEGTPLRSATNDPVEQLGAPTATLRDPTGFSQPKPGLSSQQITFENNAGNLQIDGTGMTDEAMDDYTMAPHLGSTRYARAGDVLELTVRNATGLRHPFHLHGFSFQPISIQTASATYTWPYREFRDNVDVPPSSTFRYRVRLDQRPLPDATTPGGAAGRWMFHCHIFVHANAGMMSELVVGGGNGDERPTVDADGDSVDVVEGDTATLSGTYGDPDGDPVTLSASTGTVTPNGAGHWTWTQSGAAASGFVYVTATDSAGLKAQTPFFLRVTPSTSGGGGGPGGDGGSGGSSGGDGSGGGGSDGLTLSALVDRPERLVRGAITVGCRLPGGSLRRCDASVYASRSRVGHGTTSLAATGRSSARVTIPLDRPTRRRVARSLAGSTVEVRLSAGAFGVSSPLAARTRTTVVAPTVSASSRSATFAAGSAALTPAGRAFLRAISRNVRRARSILCAAPGGPALGRSRAAAACRLLARAGVTSRFKARGLRASGSRLRVTVNR
jgi:FtsP/CotA-like multicopper oxidase with cupredoxin domain